MNEDFLERIKEEGNLTDEELEEKVADKMEEFSGLVSKEGAIHLVARELGLETENRENNDLKIENIVPGMRKVTLKARVVNVGDSREFDKDDGSTGKVRNLIIGDDTGTVRMPLWNEQTELGDKLNQGDVLGIKNAYSREDNRENVELRIGNSTKIQKLEEEDFPEVSGSSEGGDYQEKDITEINQENMNYKISGSVLALYTDNPFYDSCPECNRKVKENEDKYECEEHGEVEPKKSLAISAVIDDGTDNIRAVFFRDTARELLKLEEDPQEEEKVEEASEKILGNQVQVKGSSRYNDYFNRLEIISRDVKVLKTEEQIKKLVKELGE